MQGSILIVLPIYSPALVSHPFTSDPFRRMLLNNFFCLVVHTILSSFNKLNKFVFFYRDSVLLFCLSDLKARIPCGIIVSACLKIALITCPVQRTISIERQRKICRRYKFPVTNCIYIDFVILSNLHLLCCFTKLLCLLEDSNWSMTVLYLVE